MGSRLPSEPNRPFDNIQVRYGDEMVGSHGKNKGTLNECILNADEKIVAVRGRYGSVIDQIEFVTNQENLFNDTLDSFLEASTDKNVPMIVCGDFNINTIEENLLTKNYKNVIASNGFDLSPELPTRIATNSATCIDHFIYQNINSPTVEIMEQENISDHFPIVLECQFNYTEKGIFKFQTYIFLK